MVPVRLAVVPLAPAVVLVGLTVVPQALAVVLVGLAVVSLALAVVPVRAPAVRLALGGKRRRAVPGRPGRPAVMARYVAAGRAVQAHGLGRVRLMDLVGLVRPELAAGRALGLLAAAPRPGLADTRTGLHARPEPATAGRTAPTALTGRAAPIARAPLTGRGPLTGRAPLTGGAVLTARVPVTGQAALTGGAVLTARVPVTGQAAEAPI